MKQNNFGSGNGAVQRRALHPQCPEAPRIPQCARLLSRWVAGILQQRAFSGNIQSSTSFSSARFAGLCQGHKGTVFAWERGGLWLGTRLFSSGHRRHLSRVKALSKQDRSQKLGLKGARRKYLCIRKKKNKKKIWGFLLAEGSSHSSRVIPVSRKGGIFL